jgi:hypothetical protein
MLWVVFIKSKLKNMTPLGSFFISCKFYVDIISLSLIYKLMCAMELIVTTLTFDLWHKNKIK